MPDEPSVFAQKLATRRAAAEANQPKFDDDLIPDPTLSKHRDEELDRILDQVTIDQAYSKWCSKMEPKLTGKRESIMISCPIPTHPDKDPSAWINLDKNTWFCGGCQVGGDKYDIAAFHFGFAVPGYKTPEEFVSLREKMAADLGYQVKRTLTGQSYLENNNADLSVPAASITQVSFPLVQQSTPEATVPEQSATITSIAPDADEDEDASIIYPSIDWKALIPEGTFLDVWMKECTRDDLPEEYYFWMGLQAIGFALGRNVYLDDHTPVFGNLFICLLGRSGVGKSRAISALSRLLRAALPYDYNDPSSRGAMTIAAPGSAEALIDTFSHPVYDPNNPKSVAYYAPVNGYLRFDELSSLVSRASRMGSALKPTMMQLFDCDERIEIISRGTGHVRADEPFCSTVTTSQPKILKTLLNKQDMDSGFINRWIFAVGPEKRKFSYQGIKLDVTGCVLPLQTIQAWSSNPRALTLNEPCFTRWDEFFHKTIEPTKKQDGTDLYTRTDLLLKKLIVLLTANELLDQPTEQIVWKATTLFEYLVKAYNTVNSSVNVTITGEIEEQVIGCIRRHSKKFGGVMTLREVKRFLARHNYETEQIRKAVKILTEFGLLIEIPPVIGGRGQPSVKYKLAGEI